MKSRILTGILFVVCGIPGIWMFLFSSGVIAIRLGDPRIRAPRWSLLLLGVLLGSLLSLVGVRKIHQPAYALVFASIPISVWLFVQIAPHAIAGTGVILFFIGGVAGLTFYAVKKYYGRNDRPDGSRS